MPSINHLNNHHLALNSYRSQKNPLKSHTFKGAAKPYFGMQSAAPTEESGCLKSILNFFRNLCGKRQPSAPIVPAMQEYTPLRGNGDRDYLSLSNESVPTAPQPVTVQVSSERQPTEAYSPSKPIPIVRKSAEANTVSSVESFMPFSPPEVRREKERMRRLLGDKF